MRDEPTSNQQAHGKQDRQDSKPVPLAPPQRQEETDGENDAGDFAGDDVEAAKGQKGADERGSKVAGWKSDGAFAADHVGDAAFVGVQGDGFDVTACENGCDGMAKFMKGDDKHLRVNDQWAVSRAGLRLTN